MSTNNRIFVLTLFFLAKIAIAYDGQLDPTFGPAKNGTVFVNFNSTRSMVNSVLVQKDGKILAIGYGNNEFGKPSMAIARYTSDGQSDKSFNEQGQQPGLVMANFGFFDSHGNPITANALAGILQNEKIVIGGDAFNANNWNSDDFAIARFNINGTIDRSLNPLGKFPGTEVTKLGTHKSTH